VDAKSLRNAAKRDATASRASDAPGHVDLSGQTPPAERPGGLPRECRLAHKADFDAVYRQGRKRTSREFAVFLRANGLPVSRFGWSIKKALGTAVRRNRIRRRLREIVRLHRREISGGWDVVIHPRASVATAEFAALTAELMKLLPGEKAAGQSKE
jgi:ribonuclease P protein component